MSNPEHSRRWPKIPLVDHIKGDTRIRIVCRCGHETIMRTADLFAKLPRAVTCSDFQEKMKCKRCGLRGWARINAAGR